MSDLVTYQLAEGIATLAMDDGRVNAFSTAMLQELHAGFDRAEADAAAVVLRGREGIFSAGFDFKTFAKGREATLEMMRLGATLCERILAFPYPVVTACTGHAYPAGAFLMLSADRRVGAEGDFRIGLNEVTIKMTLPLFAVEVARHRLAPAYFHRVVTGDLYGPQEAVTAGFLDELAAPADVPKRAHEIALGLTAIDYESHAATKLRVRGAALAALRNAIETELKD